MNKNLRRVAAVLAGASLVGSLGLAPAQAAISTSTFCANVRAGSSGFTDISGVATAQRNDIECLAASKITSGTTATTYAPNGTVFRDSMATFVAKLVDTANALETQTLAALPSNPSDAFTDDENSVHEANINRLAAADIVNGKTATTYGPNGAGNEVTRGQMATFLVAALDYLRPTDLPAGTDAFTDDEGNAHEDNINKLAAIDVVDGVGGSAYDPNGKVSRAQMASFLVRTLAYLHSKGEIAALPPTTQSIRLNPSGNVTNGTDSTNGTDDVSFGAAGIAASDVDVALYPCENVVLNQGVVNFRDDDNDNVADPGADLVEADILSVNGTASAQANTERVSGVAVTNGSIAFVIDSPTADCVVAVVFDDADDDDALDLDANNRPSEQFGASGAVSFVPPPAASGGMDENVSSVDKGADTFVGCEIGSEEFDGAGPFPEEGPNAASTTNCFRFRYDSSDVFTIDGEGVVSLAQFEAALSVGDDVAGTYDADPGDQSSFTLYDEGPVPADQAGPQAVDTELFNDTAGAADVAVVDTGDIIRICFDEAINDPDTDSDFVIPLQSDTEVLTLRDADGTVGTVTQDDGANFDRLTSASTDVAAPGGTTCAANRTLQVTLGANPTITTAGSQAGLSGTTTVISTAAEIEDASGANQFAPDGDPDVAVDVEAGNEPN